MEFVSKQREMTDESTVINVNIRGIPIQTNEFLSQRGNFVQLCQRAYVDVHKLLERPRRIGLIWLKQTRTLARTIA